MNNQQKSRFRQGGWTVGSTDEFTNTSRKNQNMDLTNTLPDLYKKTQTGAIQIWNISVQDNIIITKWGQEFGAQQTTQDTINTGKNPGKRNSTTRVQQAQKEARARWDKQKKKGYVVDRSEAIAGRVDTAVIQGGIVPMLAQKYSEHADKIEWPAYAQPKLDGHRCIAIVEGDTVSLWSRTRKQITSVPHIVEDLKSHLGGLSRRCVLDGELYLHSLGNDFEHLTSLLRKKDPVPEASVVEYHIYDLPSSPGPFSARTMELHEILHNAPKSLIQVETKTIQTESDMMIQFDLYRAAGYEGLMIRNRESEYENKRSFGLQKVKEMIDDEFTIIGIEEGRGKLAGHAIFCCSTGQNEFSVKLKGSNDYLREIFLNYKDFIGRQLTVRYQNLSNDGIPRFPVGLRVRQDV